MAASVLVRNGAAAEHPAAHQMRTHAVLSDGSILVFIWSDTNDAWYGYHSTDRVTFTLKVTVGGAVANGPFSCALETGNHLQVVWGTNASATTLTWTRFTYAAGPTWTWVGTNENIASDATYRILSADLDVFGAGGCVVIYKLRGLAGVVGGYWNENVVSKCRGTAGTWSANATTSGQLLTGFNGTGTNQEWDPVTVSCDAGGVSGGNIRCFLAGSANSSGSQGASRVWVATCQYNATSGAFVNGSYNYGGTGYSTFNISQNSGSLSRMIAFKGPVANQWYLYLIYYKTSTTFEAILDYYSWTGSSLTRYNNATITGSCDWLAWCRPHVDMIQVTGETYKRPVIYTRRSAGGVYATVYNYATGITTSAFPFMGSSPYCGMIQGGSQTNGTRTAQTDVSVVDTSNGDLYHDYNQTPTAPSTGLSPVAASTVNTDIPTLQVTLPTLQATGFKRRAEWQVASDTAFTTAVKTQTETEVDNDTIGAHSEALSVANQLTQGTRYVRARTMDPFGKTSAWMAYNQFTVSHPPNAINLVPTGGAGRLYGAGTTDLDWDFSDTSPVDAQTAFQVQVERNDNGTTIYDSGKVTSASSIHTATIPVANKDMLLRWRVRLYDSDDVVGPYSDYSTFQVGDVPVINITAPAEAGTVNNPTPAVTWTFTAGGGRVQTQYRVVIKENFAPFNTVYDSGVVAGAALTHTPPTPVLANTTNYTVYVYATDNFGLEGSDSNNFGSAWAAPAAPAFALTNAGSTGYVSVTWTNASKDASWVAWRVYRRIAGTTAQSLVGSYTGDLANYDFHDWLWKAGSTYEYAVAQVALRFGEMVESVLSWTSITPQNDDYWLIHPTDETYNVRLAMVTSEDFSEEYEQETLNLIGRGRKKDYGTRWGFRGTIGAEVWDDAVTAETARQKRQKLENLKALKRDVYLRNPFGDLWLVTMGDAQIGRMAGVGQREFHTLSLSYEEVA